MRCRGGGRPSLPGRKGSVYPQRSLEGGSGRTREGGVLDDDRRLSQGFDTGADGWAERDDRVRYMLLIVLIVVTVLLVW